MNVVPWACALGVVQWVRDQHGSGGAEGSGGCSSRGWRERQPSLHAARLGWGAVRIVNRAEAQYEWLRNRAVLALRATSVTHASHRWRDVLVALCLNVLSGLGVAIRCARLGGPGACCRSPKRSECNKSASRLACARRIIESVREPHGNCTQTAWLVRAHRDMPLGAASRLLLACMVTKTPRPVWPG